MQELAECGTLPRMHLGVDSPVLRQEGSTKLKRQRAAAGMLGNEDIFSIACTVAPAARGSRMSNRVPMPGLPPCPAAIPPFKI